jgi:hypothetical protein
LGERSEWARATPIAVFVNARLKNIDGDFREVKAISL